MFLNSNKKVLLDIINDIGISKINEIELIENYTNYNNFNDMEEKINQSLKSFYKNLFKGGSEQVYGLVRAMKKLLPVQMDDVSIVNTYLYLALIYYSKNKSLKEAEKELMKLIDKITQKSINEILAILLFNNDNCKSDVNTEKSKKEIKNNYLKKVYNKL